MLEKIPSIEDLTTLIGEERCKVWYALTAMIDSSYEMERLWNSGGKAWTYEYKYRRGGKTLCALYARENCFGFMLIFGKEERAKFEAQRESFSADVCRTYDDAKTYHDGKWVMFELADTSLFEDMRRLLAIKRKPNKMFRTMRRSKQLLSAEDTEAVMSRCTNGVLACLGDEEYPYAVPLSYVYHNKKIYFHSAKTGHKIDAILKHPKVSFAVIDEDTIVSEEYTTYFRSVIAFGKARIVEGAEWSEAFAALVEKYSGDQPEEAKQKEIAGCKQASIIAVDIEYITGKEAIEYVKGKER